MNLKSLFFPKKTFGDCFAKIKERFGIVGEPVYKGFIDNGNIMIREYITSKNELVVFGNTGKCLFIDKYLPKNVDIEGYIGKLANFNKKFENNIVINKGKKRLILDRTIERGLFDKNRHSGYAHVVQTTDTRAANIGQRPFEDSLCIEERRVKCNTYYPKIKNMSYEKAISKGLKI